MRTSLAPPLMTNNSSTIRQGGCEWQPLHYMESTMQSENKSHDSQHTVHDKLNKDSIAVC